MSESYTSTQVDVGVDSLKTNTLGIAIHERHGLKSTPKITFQEINTVAEKQMIGLV